MSFLTALVALMKGIASLAQAGDKFVELWLAYRMEKLNDEHLRIKHEREIYELALTTAKDDATRKLAGRKLYDLNSRAGSPGSPRDRGVRDA